MKLAQFTDDFSTNNEEGFLNELDDVLTEMLEQCSEQNKGVVYTNYLTDIFKYVVELYNTYDFVDLDIFYHISINEMTLILDIGDVKYMIWVCENTKILSKFVDIMHKQLEATLDGKEFKKFRSDEQKG